MKNLKMSNQNKNIEAIYELSPMQQGMLFHTIYEENSSNYFEQFSVTLHGEINLSAFKEAWDKIIERHTVLRTSFVYKKLDKLLQIVHKTIELPFTFTDFSDHDEETQNILFNEFLEQDKNKKFNLSKAPLQRINLIRFAENKYKLIWSHHHILVDGWSLPIILQELILTYESLTGQQQLNLMPARPYQEFIRYLQKQDVNDAHNFWKNYFSDFTETTPIFIDSIPHCDKNDGYRKKTVGLTKEISNKLNQLAQNNGITLNTLLQAGWAILLHKYSGNNDVLFGATFSGRPATLAGSEKMVGLFINTLPIRAKINTKESIIDWINNFNKSTIGLKNYEWSSLVDIQSVSSIPAKINLFETLFVFENYPVDEILNENSDSIKFDDIQFFEQTNYPLTIVSAPGETIYIDAAFDSSKINDFIIDLLLNHFKNILSFIALNPQAKINEIDYLSDDEKEILLPVKFAEKKLPQPPIAIRHFEKAATEYKNNIAVRFRDEFLTYAELNIKANKLAHLLISRGIGPEDLVAIFMNRRIEMIISILAILKAGAGYIPIDISYPNDRIEHILSDSSANLLLTESQFSDVINFEKNEIVVFDDIEKDLNKFKTTNPPVKVYPENIAYVIYTSGSTGKPKGTMIQNKSVVNFVYDWIGGLKVTESTVQLQFASIGFDASVPEIFAPLFSGGCVRIVPKAVMDDLTKLPEFIIDNKISNLSLPPSLLSSIDVIKSPYLKTILSAGEKCNWSIVEKWSKDYLFLNGYGPTEATVGTSWGNYSKKLDTDSVPIGIPGDNIKVYVLDKFMKPVPIGIPGELYVGEQALARGYLEKPDLTALKFIPNLYSKVPGERIYQTRDLVKILPDGQIEFLGRIDKQIKLRGFRIELGEIEAVINKLKQVDQVAVILKDTAEKKLIAFIIPNKDVEFNIAEIKKEISQELPQYMIPSHFEVLEQFPVTTHGKVDRKYLQTIELKNKKNNLSEKNILSPTEELLLTITNSVLKISDSDLSDNFFDLGGHSILATQFASRIRESFKIDLSIKLIFELDNLQKLASEIDLLKDKFVELIMPELIKNESISEFPLSFAQQRMWFLQKLDPTNISNNIFSAFTISGELDTNKFHDSIKSIIVKHSILRTYFIELEGKPYQKVADGIDFELDIINLSHLSYEDQETEIKKLVSEFSKHVFNLEVPELFKIKIACKNDEECVVLLNMHHIISDGWSMGVLVKDLVNYYNSEVTLNDLEIQYQDYAIWQRKFMDSPNFEKQLEYWKNELSEIPEKIDLPTDNPRGSIQTFNGATFQFSFNENLSNKISALSRKSNLTEYMICLSAYYILLNKYARQDNIVVGTPIANRNHSKIEDLIGLFVNTLAINISVNSNEKIINFLKQVREKILNAHLYQDFPFEKLVEVLQPNRNMSHSPIFQVAFAFQNTPFENMALPGLEIKPAEFQSTISKYDITLYMQSRDGLLSGSFEYNTNLYNETTIKQMADHFSFILTQIVNDTKRKISNILLLPDEEIKNVVLTNSRNRELSRNTETIVSQFYNIVNKYSSRTAINLSYEDSNTYFTDEYTYDELNKRSNQVARYLKSKGLTKEEVVGISIERSFATIVSILGILKAGGAFLSIDKDLPNDRIRFICKEANVRKILCLPDTKSTYGKNISMIEIDAGFDVFNDVDDSNFYSDILPENLAYLIYTSGSTGKPKGVLLQHNGVVSLAEEQKSIFSINEQSNVLQFASHSFDASIWEIFMALLNGASLTLVPKETIASSNKLINLIKFTKVTNITLPPSVLSIMPENEIELGSLETIILAGEKCPQSLVKKWGKGRQFVNAYGPTESTVCASFYNCKVDDIYDPPIGKPLGDTSLFIADKYLNPLPVGVPGELLIEGKSLSRGYLNNPIQTSEKFIPNPFSNTAGSRLYKTGDLAKLLPDGNIEFLGRIDDQIKLRGFRIEIGEINSCSRLHPEIIDVFTMLRKDTPKIEQLVAYIIVKDKDTFKLTEFRSYLKNRLPEYMIPQSILIIDEFPLTQSKKVDFKRLPIPEFDNRFKQKKYIPPANDNERKIVEIGAELLGIKKMSMNDSFFELGGHSLLATQFISKINNELDVNVSIRTLFEYPVVSEFTNQLLNSSNSSEKESVQIEKQSRGSSDILDLINELDTLSDEEVKSLLDDEINSES